MAGGASLGLDVADNDDEIVVTADIPGFTEDEISLTADEEYLTISAEKNEQGGDEYARTQRRKSVSKRIPLPQPVVPEEAEASYSNGVLSVTLPKAESEGSGHEIDLN